MLSPRVWVSYNTVCIYRIQCIYCIPSYRYAYGLILWCLFSGRQNAWMDDAGKIPSPAVIILRISRGERPSVEALRPDTPSAVRALIVRCWSQSPADRPSALEVAKQTATLLQVRACDVNMALSYSHFYT